MHNWGDDWFKKNGDTLYDAQRWIARRVKRRSLCTLISKEKWGCIIFEHIVPPGGHCFCLRYNIRTLRKQKHDFTGEMYRPIIWSWTESRLYYRWQSHGWNVLSKAVVKATKKWPHLRKEIICDMAFRTELMGQELHDEFYKPIRSNEDDE